jgi:hypothetical protein
MAPPEQQMAPPEQPMVTVGLKPVKKLIMY